MSRSVIEKIQAHNILIAFNQLEYPTYREVSELVGLSLSSIHRWVMLLQQDGFLEKSRYIPRSVVLTEKGKDATRDFVLRR